MWIILSWGTASGQPVIQQPAAGEIARRNGWFVRKETPTGVIELAAIVDGVPWYNTTFNRDAADTISTDECFPTGSGGLSLTGAGVMLGVWDAGGVRLTHQEFGDRAGQADGQGVTHWHSTHVAGTMIAGGVVANATGMAPEALLDAYDWTSDTIEMAAAAAAGLRVSNHSYGFVQGWYHDPINDEYWWYGDRNISNDEDYRFGLYGGFAWVLDVIAVDHPYYLICRSVGNDRADIGPTGPGAVHFHMVTPDNVEWEEATDWHAPDGDYDTITLRNTAKNILTVGAVADVMGGYAGPGSVVMTEFSGWGPTDDGRIKPDLVANGTDLFSAFDADDNAYGTLSGTSMAAPSVAGSLGLLIEHWRATHPVESDMRSATLKGLVLHTADEAGTDPGPDYEFGWGLMNSLAAANVISADVALPLTISEWTLVEGETLELLITTDGASDELRATIQWTDPPGPGQVAVLDPPTKILVNDLDLRVESLSPPALYLPWVLDGANPQLAATTGDNDTDNVEQVVVGMPGTNVYVLHVSHKAMLVGGAQPVSLIITGADTIEAVGTTNVPAISLWGGVVLVLLSLTAGTLVFMCDGDSGFSSGKRPSPEWIERVRADGTWLKGADASGVVR